MHCEAVYITQGVSCTANLPGLRTNYTSGKPVHSPYTHSARCTDVSDSDPLLVNVLQINVDKHTRYYNMYRSIGDVLVLYKHFAAY